MAMGGAVYVPREEEDEEKDGFAEYVYDTGSSSCTTTPNRPVEWVEGAAGDGEGEEYRGRYGSWEGREDWP